MEGVSSPSSHSPSGKPANEPLTDATAAIPVISDDATGAIVVAENPKLTWLDRAQRVVASDKAPTWSLDLRAIQDGVEEKRARNVVDLSMRIAEALLSTGASAAEVTASVLRITTVYGLKSVHVDVTFTSIDVCHYRGTEAPIYAMRTVRVRSADYERLARLQRLVNEIEDERGLSVAAARRRFERIAAMPRRYRRSVVTAATAVLGTAVCVLLDGSTIEVLIALANAVIVDRTQLWLARRKLPAFFAQMVGGMVPTIGAVALIYARASVPGLEDISPSAVVATGIVVLLAGLSVVGAAQDAIDGYYLTATARSAEVVVLTLGIVVGVMVVLTISTTIGAPMSLAAYSRLTGNFAMQVLASAVIAGMFAISSYAGPRTALLSVLTGALGWSSYALMIAGGFGVAAASGVAALVVGAVAQLLGRRWQVPSLALSTAGIVPLLPGLSVYRGLYHLATAGAEQGYGQAFDSLGTAMSIGLALAAGVSLGAYLGRATQPNRGAIRDRARDRALHRSRADAKE